jgi:hypothetical protein
MADQDEKLVTLSKLAELAGTTTPRVHQLFHAGILGTPDFVATSGSLLWKPKNVAALVEKIRNYGISRSFNRKS